MAGCFLALFSWSLIARSSGSGWVQALGAVLGALFLVGLLAPWVALRGAQVVCADALPDAPAGERTPLTLQVDRPLRITPLVPAGVAALAGGPSSGPRPATVELIPDRRGVLTTITVEVASSAPFGLLWWGRRVEVALPVALHVAPRQGAAREVERSVHASAGEAPRRVEALSGEPRGVRPYQPGDPRHGVHWPATAHAGELMVRQWERQVDDPVVIEVSLPPGPIQAEAEAERVMATVGELLARGVPVVLVTVEASGRVQRQVRDRRELGRRMARAITPTLSPPRRRSSDPRGAG